MPMFISQMTSHTNPTIPVMTINYLILTSSNKTGITWWAGMLTFPEDPSVQEIRLTQSLVFEADFYLWSLFCLMTIVLSVFWLKNIRLFFDIFLLYLPVWLQSSPVKRLRHSQNGWPVTSSTWQVALFWHGGLHPRMKCSPLITFTIEIL